MSREEDDSGNLFANAQHVCIRCSLYVFAPSFLNDVVVHDTVSISVCHNFQCNENVVRTAKVADMIAVSQD